MSYRQASAAVVSFRLGGADGVSIESAKWVAALRRLGLNVRTVAGAGKADHLVDGLELDATRPVSGHALTAALADADLVVVENICSLPRNIRAAAALSQELAGRPALMHHHDLPWQLPGLPIPDPWPPTDPAWRHITINAQSEKELLNRGVPARYIPNTFDSPARPGRRNLARRLLGVEQGKWLLLHPTRALPHKDVPAGLGLATALGATYWLTGPAEDGYQEEFERLLATARCPVRHGLPDGLDMADAYAAADGVVFPSSWEGFGNPVIESALHRRPLAVASYPVLHELAACGLRWFPVDQPDQLRKFLARPDKALLDHNAAIAAEYFPTELLDHELRSLFLGSESAFRRCDPEPVRGSGL